MPNTQDQKILAYELHFVQTEIEQATKAVRLATSHLAAAQRRWKQLLYTIDNMGILKEQKQENAKAEAADNRP